MLADATGLMQMALNLCINARDALMQAPQPETPGRIRLELGPAVAADLDRQYDIGEVSPGIDHIRIEVSDNGPGMDAATRARVFTPYFSTKGDKGTGLGVPIAAEAVRDHGGALSLETSPGAGTSFVILLPVAAPGGPVRNAT